MVRTGRVPYIRAGWWGGVGEQAGFAQGPRVGYEQEESRMVPECWS